MFQDENSVNAKFASDRRTEMRRISEIAIAVRSVMAVIVVKTTKMATDGTKIPTVTAKPLWKTKIRAKGSRK